MTDLIVESQKIDNKLELLIEDWHDKKTQIESEIKHYTEILGSAEAKGDRSENATFQIAKDSLDMKMSTLAIISEKLDTARVHSTKYTHTPFIAEGSTVELSIVSVAGQKDTTQEHFIVKVVHHDLGQIDNGLLAMDSKVGAALLGHQEGDIIEVQAIRGLIKYKIERMY